MGLGVDPHQQENMQRVVQMIAGGVLRLLHQQFPGGISNPAQPYIVERGDEQGNTVRVQTTLIQQIAELNDNLMDLNDLTEQALGEAKRGRKSRRRR